MTATAGVVYGYLTVEQRPADVVTFPDGRSDIHGVGEGEAVAQAWNAAAADAQRTRDAEADAAPAGRPEVSDAEVERVLAERMADWERRLTESVEVADTAFGSPEGRRATFLRRNPQPTLEGVREDLTRQHTASRRRMRAGVNVPLAAVEQQPAHWWTRLSGPGANLDRPLAPPGPLPGGDVAALLSDLARDGWDVLHVSEERAVHHEEVRSVTVCIGLKMIVRRVEGPEVTGPEPR